ncbi:MULTISPECIES: TonB-dependent receptor domain-containing protein [Sphingomonas]|uniref:TonB-dependent receptor domain-containing protein n=1 Tax=Sphingomonas TaxID=13687 RepID=UPI001F082895|nr:MULTISPECIES: TonB-dependent receptor [Sphingomonas]
MAPTFAAPPPAIIDIPDATLDVAVVALARQAGAEIVSTERGLNRVRSRAVRGRLPVAAALEQLLAGTPFEALRLASGAFVIRRRPAPPPVAAHAAPRRQPLVRQPQVAEAAPPVVIVQASKQQTPLIRYPGAVTSVSGIDPLRAGSSGRARDLSDLGETMPVLQGTHLGPGRDKLFIRGIADSSFSGSTQSPTSLYWDDVQLNYTGPDPGLRLYDVSSVDVLEGPQGTLYGSGAIGGVIRVNSNPVDLGNAGGALGVGITATQEGEPGADGAAMLNLPLVSGVLGLRAVGYASREGGYLNDLRRGANDINRTTTRGGRLTARFRPGAGWQVEAGGVFQAIRSRDGQYALRSAPALSRRSAIAQPYRNQFALGRLSVGRQFGNGLQFQSTTAIVGYRSTDQFDATGATALLPVTYVAERHKRLLSHESRLSRKLPDGASWVVGVGLIDNRDSLARTFFFVDQPVSVTGVTNKTTSLSAFVEATRPLSRRLSATLGARVTTARVDGDPSINPRPGTFVRGHPTRRIDPTAALVWEVRPDTTIFARLQSGFRTGGLAVAPGVGRVSDFESDTVRMSEVGVRHLKRGATGLSIGSTVSLTYWNDIQADLITRRGTPNTVNLGDARILSWEGNAEWTPLPDLTAKGSFLVSRNRVTGPMADLSQRRNRRLPNTPLFSASGEMGYRWRALAGAPNLKFSASYVGRSVLGTGDLFDIAQGRYLLLGAAAGIDWRGFHWSLAAENLGNAAANRFSYGNPFTLVARDQITPLRPRSVRLGVSTRW